MHDHHHRCLCEHDRVRFCRSCRTVYCEDCRQEWVTRPLYAYGWAGSPFYSYSTQGLSNLTAGGLQQASGNVATVTASACGHGGT